MAPAGTPRPVIDKLGKAAMEATAAPEVAKAWEPQGILPLEGGPDDLARYIASETRRWGAKRPRRWGPRSSNVSRAQRSTSWWCAADPGPLGTPNVERSRISSAAFPRCTASGTRGRPQLIFTPGAFTSVALTSISCFDQGAELRWAHRQRIAADAGQLCLHGWVLQRLHRFGVELVDDVFWRAPRGPETDPEVILGVREASLDSWSAHRGSDAEREEPDTARIASLPVATGPRAAGSGMK